MKEALLRFTLFSFSDKLIFNGSSRGTITLALKSIFWLSKNCVHKQCSQCSCSCVETLVILRAKFHVVLSLLNVLKIASVKVPLALPLKMSLPENENTVNLKVPLSS